MSTNDDMNQRIRAAAGRARAVNTVTVIDVGPGRIPTPPAVTGEIPNANAGVGTGTPDPRTLSVNERMNDALRAATGRWGGEWLLRRQN